MAAHPHPHPFRFGVVAAQARTAGDWRALASRIEADGYSSLLLPDTAGPVLAPFSALAAAAAWTSRLRVGNWVLANDFRNPVLVAREAATLDLLADGRYELGLGAGRGDHVYASLGLPTAGSGGERLRRLSESLHVIRALFEGQSVTFSGEFVSVTNASLYPPPLRQLPILIAASGPRAIQVAGRYADIVALGSDSRERFQQQADGLAAAAGERFERIELASLVFVVPDDDPAVAQAARDMARWLAGLDLDAMIARQAPNVLVGSARAMVEQLEERRSALGLSYVVINAQAAAWLAPIVQQLTGH